MKERRQPTIQHQENGYREEALVVKKDERRAHRETHGENTSPKPLVWKTRDPTPGGQAGKQPWGRQYSDLRVPKNCSLFLEHIYERWLSKRGLSGDERTISIPPHLSA